MSILKKGILQKVENGGGGTGTGILGEVNTFSDLPASATTGDRYLVLTYSISTPTKLKGVYRWNGSSWDRQNGARAFDVVYDNSGSTLTSVNLEASTNELDSKVNGKEPSFTKNTAFNKNFGTVSGTVAEGNDSRFTNHLSSFTQNSGQYIATEGIRARDIGGVALLNDDGLEGITVADSGDVDITTKMSASEIKARNVNGLKLHDDGGNGLIVKDGGATDATHLITSSGGIKAKGNSGSSFYADSETSVNIGTLNNLYAFIEMNSSDGSGGWIDFTDASGTDYKGRFRYVNSSNQFQFFTNGSQKMVLNTNGYLGIGNTNPQSRLHIEGSTGDGSAIRFKADEGYGATDRVLMYPEGGSTFSFKTLISGAFRFRDSDNTTVLLINTNSRRVGINTATPSQAFHVVGNAIVSGSLSKGSGSFDITHPDPDKKDTHRLRHYFVETPSAGGNIYKYQIKCKEGNNYIDLPDYFQFLNKDSLVWVNPFKHFGRAWGEVENDKKIKIVAEQKGVYNILVFGDRKDEAAMKDFNKYGIEYKIKK